MVKFPNLVSGEAFIPGKERCLAMVVGDRCLKFALLKGINYPYLKMNVLLYFFFSLIKAVLGLCCVQSALQISYNRSYKKLQCQVSRGAESQLEGKKGR